MRSDKFFCTSAIIQIIPFYFIVLVRPITLASEGYGKEKFADQALISSWKRSYWRHGMSSPDAGG